MSGKKFPISGRYCSFIGFGSGFYFPIQEVVLLFILLICRLLWFLVGGVGTSWVQEFWEKSGDFWGGVSSPVISLFD